MGHSAIAFIIVIGVLVFIHELGHFIAARLCGIGVEVFSLGFGPKLLKKKYGNTEYCVSAIPLGGYVKMVGEEPGNVIDPDSYTIVATESIAANKSNNAQNLRGVNVYSLQCAERIYYQRVAV